MSPVRVYDAGMMSYENRRQLEQQTPETLASYQLSRLNKLLEEILPHNRFYAEKLSGIELPLQSLDQLTELHQILEGIANRCLLVVG